jgi:hypothetical protein
VLGVNVHATVPIKFVEFAKNTIATGHKAMFKENYQ